MEPTDHIKAFLEAARPDLYTNHVDLHGLGEAREHQRGSFKGRALRRKNAKREFTPAQIHDILTSLDPFSVLAERHGTTKQTIANIRRNKG